MRYKLELKSQQKCEFSITINNMVRAKSKSERVFGVYHDYGCKIDLRISIKEGYGKNDYRDIMSSLNKKIYWIVDEEEERDYPCLIYNFLPIDESGFFNCVDLKLSIIFFKNIVPQGILDIIESIDTKEIISRFEILDIR